jgi:hypothetical protein
VAPLQSTKRSGVEIVHSGWGNGRFSNYCVKGDVSEIVPWPPP